MQAPLNDSFFVPPEQDGWRLDRAVRARPHALSQQQARTLCAIGAVVVAGVRAEAQTRLRQGEQVCWSPAVAPLALELGLPVLWDDGTVLVLHKPPGLAVHQGPLVGESVAGMLQRRLPEASLCQRLDRPASGLLLCGRTRAATAALSTRMEQGSIECCYLAVALGQPERDAFTVDLPLLATDEPRGDRPKVIVDRQQGQRAVTHVEVLARSRRHSLLRLSLETGRTHQIRAHLGAIGHPVLGDPRYGDAAANLAAQQTHGIDRTMLHCERLALRSPADDALVEVRAPHEPDFARLFAQLRARPAS